MKAVVLETGPKYTIVLTKEGEFVRVKTRPHYRVGVEIEYPEKAAAAPWLRMVAAAAVLLVFVGAGSLALAFAIPYSYVNIDINPSVELAVNRFDYIIDVKSLNAGGDAIVATESLLYKPLREGVEMVLESLNREGYLPAGSPSTVLLTYVSENRKKIERFDQVVREAVRQKLPEQSQVEVYVLHADLQIHRDAEKQNLSSGRLLLLQELQKAASQDLNPTEMKDVPIGEIVKKVREKQAKANWDEESLRRQELLKQVRPLVPPGREKQESQQLQERKTQRQDRFEPEREDRKEDLTGKDRRENRLGTGQRENQPRVEQPPKQPRVEQLEERRREEQQDQQRQQERLNQRREPEPDGEEMERNRAGENRSQDRERPERKEERERVEMRRGQERKEQQPGRDDRDHRQDQEPRDRQPRQGRDEGGAGKML